MQRNNIDLKNIADNKANILLSLNALMLTFLIPIVLGNIDIIVSEYLYIPLGFLFLTCFGTILIAASVLKPFNWIKTNKTEMQRMQSSPFFFVNYYKLSIDQFVEQMDRTITDSKIFKEHVVNDLFFIGKVLGVKYNQIGICYNVFLIGLSTSIVSTILVVAFL
jgi:hypothetical protein